MYKKIQNELEKKSKDSLKKYKFIGAEIKSSRLKMSKTLDSIGNVNKSISYISKIENNKIIPNERCLRELCDELLIPREDLENMSKFDECILDAIDAIYMLDYDKMKSLYAVYSSFTNIRTNLMKGLYFFMFDNHKEIKSVIKSLEKIESSLSIEDYLVYVLISLKNLKLENQNLQAFKILKVIINSQTAKGNILNIFKDMKFEIKNNFYLYSSNDEFQEIIKMHISSNNIKRVKEVLNLYNKQKIELLSFDCNDEDFLRAQSDELKFYAYCLTNNIKEATKFYNDNISDEYKLYYFYKTKQTDLIMNMISCDMTEGNMILANCYKYELDGNVEVYRNYLINICVPYFKEITKISKLIHYTDILVHLNSQVSKYKDSVSLTNDVLKLISEVIRTTV